MFAEVIPLVRLPKKLSFFDYEVPQEIEGQIKIGQIVVIPFRGKKIKGVVGNIKKEAQKVNAPIKKILKILSDEPIIDEKGLDLLSWIADYYVSSLPLVAKTFLPEPPLVKRSRTFPENYLSKQLTVSKSDAEEIKKLLALLSDDKKISLLHFDNFKNKTVILLKCAEKAIAEGRGVLILEPQVPDVLGILPYFVNLFPDKTAVLHGEMSKTEYWQQWQKIKSGKAGIVIGTRSALCAPLAKIGLVIVDNEESSDFKQSDQNPRYDTRETSLKRAEITGAKIIFTSQAPRPETYFLSKNRPDAQYLASTMTPRFPTVLVDMNGEIKNKNFSPLSEKIKEEISSVLTKKQKIVLLLNRRGGSTLILCRDCDYVFRCKRCDNPLTCHENECNLPNKLICHNCGSEEPISLKCPNCQGSSIKYAGMGTQALEREIKKIFPEKKILRIDSDSETANIGKKIAEADILIGTQFFIRNYLIQTQDVGLVGIFSADTLLYRPDFRSSEKTFSWLRSIINFAHSLKTVIIIQTFFPNNFVIQGAAGIKPDEFYGEELDNRLNLNYPPFGFLAKLSYADKNAETCLKEASNLYEKIKNGLAPLAEISVDEKPRLQKNKFFCKIILKFSERNRRAVKDFLEENIPDEWTIDIDPESLL